MTQRTDVVREILSWYAGNPPGVIANLARMLEHGRLAGTGKLVILPVDQGFEHGPARSFASNPQGYDPRFHVELAIESGCNAYAAPLGFIEAIANDYAGRIPLILKVNNNDSLTAGKDPCSAVTSSVKDALRLGCSAIGYTIYPGTAHKNTMLEQVRTLIEEARQVGLPTVMWSYPRGTGLSKDGETGIDVVAYAAHMACQLGAHIVKVKPASNHVEQDAARKVYAAEKIPIGTLAERTKHVVDSCFAGRRIVIFSGGEAKDTPAVLSEIEALAAGGSFGSIMGRNAFQRPKADAIALLHSVMDVYAKASRA